MIERLETERLILRRPAARDEAGAMGFLLSPRADRIGGPFKPARAWQVFAAEVAHWDLRGYGGFAVTQRGSDRCLGIIGPFCPTGWPEPEMGWMLWEEAEGRSIGYEAARACLRHLFRDLGWTSTVSYIDADNARSIALAERLGAQRDTATTPPHPDDIVYRHMPTEDLPREDLG
ncbi:MAG: GNAT family N-acetyltransferase [Pseudomonadota bacterium]